ncbi:MAG: RNA polymerase sigma factor, partial [Planctomycetota bacterium]
VEKAMMDLRPGFPSDGLGGQGNPLASDSPEVWDRLISAVGPASLLVVIGLRMSTFLKHRLAPEDILQEALLDAWRHRARHEWRGLRSFRAWLLTIIDHRVRDAAAYESAAKRGGEASTLPFSALELSDSQGEHGSAFPGPVRSTTPSRIAIHREQAEMMRAALDALPSDLGEVVRLRLFEQLTTEEIAGRLNIGPSAVRHRFRRGAELYQRRLMFELASRTWTSGPPSAKDGPSL